ncbi:MAG: hypothetical protein H8E44_43320 [Planctomycetes bacterium]|nr:hypothetical protein [Planctomycetota bacterium]MBL7042844.1 hypothetical protein [Pirellulaceae bacterium]
MSTVVELTEQELTELKTLTNEADAALAVRSAMTEYLRFARRMRLKELSGQVKMEENWQSLEEAEMREQDGSSGDSAG